MTVEQLAREGGPADVEPTLNVLLCLAPAKVSEPRIAGYQQIPNSRVVLVGHESRDPAPNLIRLPAWRLPYLGAPERWTAALSWYRNFGRPDPGPVDCVMSLEMHSPTSFQANRLAKRLGVPHVVTVAEVLNPYPLYSLPPWRQFCRSVSKSADAFVCNVEMARQSAIAVGCDPDKCVVIAPGVDVKKFSPKIGGTAASPVLLFVGELRPDKGVLDVIAAADLARTRIPDLRLVIVGDGPLRGDVVELARRYSFIDYRGKVQREQLPGVFREARSFIIAPKTRPFWAEQFGFASIEAMASGLPVVITDSGAVPEVIPDWNPICPQGDVNALAAAIVTTQSSTGEVLGKMNRTQAEEHFDVGKQALSLRRWLGDFVASDP
jgi:glycosyltransferase involved in cell wall biosynthesis